MGLLQSPGKDKNCEFAIPSSLSCDFDELEAEFGLPMILKPRKGSASRGIVKISNKQSFERYKDEIGTKLMVQPLIGSEDEEFTSGAFCDGNGAYYTIITFKRKLSKEGYTDRAEVFPK